jgi:hypothetical protein
MHDYVHFQFVGGYGRPADGPGEHIALLQFLLHFCRGEPSVFEIVFEDGERLDIA